MSVNDRDRDAPSGPIAPSTGQGRRGFADLAELGRRTAAPNGAEPPAAERSENSGIIDLAALAAAEANTVTPAAQAPAPVVDALAAKISADAPPKTTPESQPPLWAAFLLGAAVALGVVVFVLFLGRGQPTSTRAAVAQNAVTPVRVVPAEPPLPHAAPADRAPEVDFSQLPPATPSIDNAPSAAASSPGEHNGPATPRAVAPPVAAGASSRPAARTSGGSEKALDALMQEAVGGAAPSAPVRPPPQADTTTNAANAGVPLKPSQGAVNGALGIALPAARACLEPDSPISRATITFRSDGTVSDVVVEDWAAGKPVEGCIRAALRRAVVPPFAQPTYSVPATIRSN